MTEQSDIPRLVIALPGGRVARVPMDVLEQYAVEGTAPAHGEDSPPKPPAAATAAPASITINVYTSGGAVSVAQAGQHAHPHPHPEGGDDDVVAHGLSIDPVTGASVWHTDWELGWCTYTDDAGFPQTAYVWHRHPLGNEYAELYR
jgi:hypothetical protein